MDLMDLIEYLSLPAAARLAHIDDEEVIDEDREELERLGVSFEPGDIILDPDEG